MSPGRATILPTKDGEYRVNAPIRLQGRVLDHWLRFPTLEAARDFCACCDFTWSIHAAPLTLEPPPPTGSGAPQGGAGGAGSGAGS